MIHNEDTYCNVQHKIVRELGAWEAVVHGTIANLLRKTDGYGNVSNDTLISLIGRDKKSIYRWIDRLVDAGYLEKVGGKGRGNISIYYITKKGGNMTPFNEEKRGQIDTEKGANMTEKGGNMTPFNKRGQIDTEKGANMTKKGGEMPPINKGKNKEINKESGGDNAHEARDPHALSDTTPLNFENMEDFNLFWELYPGDPEWSNEKENCERVWYALQQNWRDNLIQQLREGKRWRVRENDNPYWYLKNYNGEVVRSELPYLRQGTATFVNWVEKNKREGIRMCLLHFEERVAYCLYSDLQTMLDAGARLLDNNWK